MNIKDFTTGVQHIGIPTNNIEETINFYLTLGFEVALRTVNGAEEVAFLQLHNLVIETYQNHQAKVVQRAGLKMLDTKVNGLPFWENGVKFFTIEGPNKEKIEFCEKL